jgi:hypothetical protein
VIHHLFGVRTPLRAGLTLVSDVPIGMADGARVARNAVVYSDVHASRALLPSVTSLSRS